MVHRDCRIRQRSGGRGRPAVAVWLLFGAVVMISRTVPAPAAPPSAATVVEKTLAPVRHAPSPRPAALRKITPDSIGDLEALQKRFAEIARKVTPAVVALRIGRAQGSGVIVSRDGYVLTAGHVIGSPGKSVSVTLADGRRLTGRTLGRERTVDSGLVKLDGDGPWPFAELGMSESVRLGDWCLAMGHPEGYQKNRPPVVRTGRVIESDDHVMWTDCALFSGDSGGPLFDLDGRVIGIHSRVAGPVHINLHVPVNNYHATWQRLAAGDTWPAPGGAVLGVNGESHRLGCRVTKVFEGQPAAQAGLHVGDIIVSLDGQAVEHIEDLARLIGRREPGDEVDLHVHRAGETFQQRIKLGRR